MDDSDERTDVTSTSSSEFFCDNCLQEDNYCEECGVCGCNCDCSVTTSSEPDSDTEVKSKSTKGKPFDTKPVVCRLCKKKYDDDSMFIEYVRSKDKEGKDFDYSVNYTSICMSCARDREMTVDAKIQTINKLTRSNKKLEEKVKTNEVEIELLRADNVSLKEDLKRKREDEEEEEEEEAREEDEEKLDTERKISDGTVGETKECVACIRNLPLNVFIGRVSKKNKLGEPCVYAITRSVCNTCRNKNQRDKKKMKTSK